jgi:hypothetical protein
MKILSQKQNTKTKRARGMGQGPGFNLPYHPPKKDCNGIEKFLYPSDFIVIITSQISSRL